MKLWPLLSTDVTIEVMVVHGTWRIKFRIRDITFDLEFGIEVITSGLEFGIALSGLEFGIVGDYIS